MSIVQEIINGDDTYEIANQILLHDLPNIDLCDAAEKETYMSECRWALSEKVRQVVLMHAFREDPTREDQTLDALCTSARKKILHPSFIAAVQEFVLLDLDLRDRSELHPHLATVEAESLSGCNRIIHALRSVLEEKTMDDEGA